MLKLNNSTGSASRVEAIVYGIPVYGDSAEGVQTVDAPFFKLNLKDEYIVNAYRYVAYKFGQYLLLKRGAVVREYDPLTGRLTLEGNLTPDKVRSEYSNFVREYLVPKIKASLAHANIDDVLPAFYYRRGESNPTGLSPVILAARHVQHYFNALTRGKYNLQGSVKNSIERAKNRAHEAVKRLNLEPNAVMVIDKSGDVRPLTDDDMASVLQHVARSDVVGVRKVEKKRCIHCDAADIPLLPATGKLGVGRTRLPHERTTHLSDKAQICLRCLLVSLFYMLDTGGDFFFQLNGFTTRFRDRRRGAEGETLAAVLTALGKLANHPRSIALIYNSLFGSERVALRIEGLDEEAFEKLAILYAATGKAEFGDEVQSLLVSYVNAPSFSDSLRILIHILKKQLEKGGVPNMSYVSKYITSRLYAQRKDKRVAYALAKLADAVVYGIDQSNISNKDYVKRRFADTLRRAGLSKAVTYAVSATKTPIEVLTVPVRSGEEREHIKRILDEYNIRYEEEAVFKVYIDSVPLAEIRIVEEFTPKIYEDVYTYLVVLQPTLEVGEVEEEGGEVSESA